ncbi:hypothetical protein [Romeriopsis navalis]|nr:hypothetical protein [Romeriopsis navalis]
MFLRPQQQPVLYRGDRVVPVLSDLDLILTASQVFSWLNMV